MKILIIILLFTQYIFCQTITPRSTRSFSLGQSHLLSTSDIVDIYNNPSSIARIIKTTTSLNYSIVGKDTYAIGVGFCIPTKYGNFGLGYYKITMKGLIKTSVYAEEEGTYTFYKDYFTVGYTNKLFDDLYIGINGNFLSEKIDTYKSGISNPGIDISFQYFLDLKDEIFKEFVVGILFKNLVKPGISYPTSTEYLPLDIIVMTENSFCFNEHLLKLILNFDYYVRKEIKDQYAIFKNKDIYGHHIALEYIYKYLLFLRIGYFSDSVYVVNNDDEFGDYMLSYGMGIKIKAIRIDYGYGSYGNRYTIDPTHKVSISVAF